MYRPISTGLKKGQVTIYFILLFTIPVIVFAAILAMSQLGIFADIKLQESVAEAVRAAALQINLGSMANGTPEVDTTTNNCLHAFTSILAKNLGLDSNFNPLPGSGLASSPEVILVIYNGSSDGLNQNSDNIYGNSPFGDSAVKEYMIINGNIEDITNGNINNNGFSSLIYGDNNFNITFNRDNPEESIEYVGDSYPSSGININMKRPGVIAVVYAQVRDITGSGYIGITRYAASQIVGS